MYEVIYAYGIHIIEITHNCATAHLFSPLVFNDVILVA